MAEGGYYLSQKVDKIDDQKDAQKNEDFGSLLNQPLKEFVQKSKKSDYVSTYSSFFSDQQFYSQNIRRMRIIDQLCQQGNIRYEEDDFVKNMQLKLFNATVGYEVVHLQAKIGHFTMPVIIYNAEGQSPAHQMPHMVSTFASIYSLPSESRTIIKCFQLKQEDELKTTIRSAIKQNCLLKLAAAMKAGPAMSELFGFDLVMFDDFIQFAMEQCEDIEDINKEEEAKLKASLYDLHSISLIHMDIKPANICYSPSLQKHIFIDFGLSEIISQLLGTKSLTKFSGTLNYCSPQMFRLYHNTYDLVDLYYNDVFCFQQTIRQIQQSKQSQNRFQLFRDDLFERQKLVYKRVMNRLLEEFLIFETKSRLYRLNSINNKKYEDCIKQNFNKFIKFIRRLPYSFFLENILSQNLQFPNREKVQIWSAYHYKRYSFELASCYQENSIFQHRFRWLIEENFCNNELSSLKRIYHIKHQRDIVMKPNVAIKMSRKVYLQAYVKFVDFQVRKSSFKQKQQASQQMINFFESKTAFLKSSNKNMPLNISFVNKDEQAAFSHISLCFVTIMNEFLTNLIKPSTILLIPTVFHNLIILECLSYQQLLNLITRILNLPNNSTSLMKLLLGCSFAFDFVHVKCNSRYQGQNISKQVFGKIIWKMREIMKNESGDKLIEVILWLIEHDRNHQAELPVPSLLLLIEQILGNCKDSFMLELVLYYYAISLSRNSFPSEPIKTIRLIRALQYFQQSQLKKRGRFQYYHFRIAKKANDIGNWEMIKTIYQRLENCLQHPLLLAKYSLYHLNICLNVSNDPQAMASYYCKIIQHTPIQNLIYQCEIFQGLEEALQICPPTPEMQRIYSILDDSLNLDLILGIESPDNIFNRNILGFYHSYYYLVFIFYTLNSQKPNIYQEMNQLLNKITQHWSNIFCTECKRECQVFIILLKGFLLQAQGQFEQALHAYQLKQPVSYTLRGKYPLLLKIMRLGALHQDLQQKYNIINRVYSVMIKQQQIYLLVEKEGKFAFLALSQHFYRKNDIDGLVDMHLWLCKFLFQSLSVQQISNYALHTSLFFSQHPISTESLIKKYYDFFHRQGLQFSALFLSIAFRNEAKSHNYSVKAILTICELTLKLPFFARKLVLANLYQSLLNFKRKIQTKQKLIRFWFLEFAKNVSGQIKTKQFFEGIGFKRRKGLKHNHLYTAIIRYIKNIFDKEEKGASFNDS